MALAKSTAPAFSGPGTSSVRKMPIARVEAAEPTDDG